MKVAVALAKDYFERHFKAEVEAREEQKRQALAKRMATEQLFRIEPKGEPQLLDRGYLGHEETRTPESLRWAEARMISLGFEIRREGRIVSYVREHETVVVYADPRRAKNLEFKCYPKRKKRKNEPFYGRVVIQDSWRRDLSQKFQNALEQAADPWATPEQLVPPAVDQELLASLQRIEPEAQKPAPDVVPVVEQVTPVPVATTAPAPAAASTSRVPRSVRHAPVQPMAETYSYLEKLKTRKQKGKQETPGSTETT